METVSGLLQDAKGFGYLASVFLGLPDRALVEGIRSLEPCGAACGGDPAIELASAYARDSAGKSDEEVLRELGVDRARLVRHVDVTCIAPPYESLYVSESEDMVLRRINSFFEEEGFAPRMDAHMPNDYLGMELSFMQFALQERARALEAGDAGRAHRMREACDRFWNDHLGRWVAKYGAQMASAAQTGYYRSVGMLLCNLA